MILHLDFSLDEKNNKRNLRYGAANANRKCPAGKNSNTEAYNFTDNHVFGARAVNQIRVQWSRFQPSYQSRIRCNLLSWSAIAIR